ncbi:MAG: hypothetical protein U0Q18_31545 [Bryobacteraceae bacterium]
MSPVEAIQGNGAPTEQTRVAAEPASAGNVEKIRDILFGPQMRDYEHRFARLEETLLKECADLRESTRKRFDALETYIQKEFEALEGRLRTERDERGSLGESLARKIVELNDQTSMAQRDLRGTILQQSKDLSAEIERRHVEISAILERRFQELRRDKTDRAALAALFNEVALRLNDEFTVPGMDA